MERTEFDKYLKDRVEKMVDWYDRKAVAMKCWYTWFQTVVIVLAALTTVAAAFGAADGKIAVTSQWATVVISALVTIGTTMLGTFKYKETWLNYRGTYDALKREKSFYLAQVGDYGKATDREGLFIQRVEAILANESAEWQSVQHLKDLTDKPKSGNQ